MKAKRLGRKKAGTKRTPAKARLKKRAVAKRRTSPAAPVPAIARKFAWHYRTLLALRDRLMQDTQRKLRDVADPIESHSMHLADSATDEFDHDLALAMLAREESALTEVNDAITRMLEGRYGLCEETGARIPALRLRALPWCRYALAVEEQLERTGTVAKFKLPPPASIREGKPNLPGTGRLPREGVMEGEEDLEGENEAAVVKEESAGSATAEEPGPAAPPPATRPKSGAVSAPARRPRRR